MIDIIYYLLEKIFVFTIFIFALYLLYKGLVDDPRDR
jgi:hypothetical protein